MRQSRIFFGRVYLSGTGVAGYPVSRGTTRLVVGLEHLRDVLGPIYESYSDSQKSAAKFPIFVMTDGELTGTTQVSEAQRKKVFSESKRMSDSISKKVGGASKTEFTGLGLSSKKDTTLRSYQTILYGERIGLGYKFEANKQRFFFDGPTSTARIISQIFGTIEKNCEDCYTFDTQPTPTTICVNVGDDKPDAPGTERQEKIPLVAPDITDSTPITEDSDEITENILVKYGDKIRVIPAGTKLCYRQYEINGKPIGSRFTTYDDKYNCDCCRISDEKCLCDFRKTDPIGTASTTVSGITDVPVDVYDESDPFIQSLIGSSSNDFPEVDTDAPEQPPPPIEEDVGDNPGSVDNTGSGSNDAVEDGPDEPEDDDESTEPEVKNPEKINDSDAESVVPSFAALFLATVPLVLA